MLTRLAIRNFQSLRHVDIELGAFTVIVGPSSSGKSALIRACRALASNMRGSGVITRGQKVCAITGHTETAKITLERSETASGYRIHDGDSETVFTKLAGAVPEQVTQALRIAPAATGGTSVNFAGQFDRPYLLDESGSNVARELGELTNVTAIFEAVRRANKIRLNASGTLRTRQNDLADLRARLEEFRGLSDRLAALDEAEKLAEQAQTRKYAIDRLSKALLSLRLAENALAKAEKMPAVPDPAAMNLALNRLLDFKGKMQGFAAKVERVATALNEVADREHHVGVLEQDLKTLLEINGVCPTCGQSTKYESS